MLQPYMVIDGLAQAVDGARLTDGQRSVGGLMEWAAGNLAAGVPLADVQAEALALDGVALMDWPAPAAGKVLKKHVRLADADLSAMPEPRTTLGPIVFASTEADPVPPLPDELSNVQFFEGLMLDLGVITPAQYGEWSREKTLPEPFALAISAHLTNVPEPEREATEAIILGRLRQATRFPRVDPFAEIIKMALQMTPEQWDNFFRAAGQR